MRRIYLSTAIGIAVGLFMIWGGYRFIGDLLLSGGAVRAKTSEITSPATATLAATEIARLCQSDPSLYKDEPPFPPAWAPPVILAMNPMWFEIEETTARVEFGGGFHHFGYTLARDDARSTSSTNVWILNHYDEVAGTRELCRVELRKDDRVEPEEFVARAMTEYGRRMSTYPRNDDVIDRIRFLFKHTNRQTVVQSIRDFATRHADDWLDQILCYVVDHKSNLESSTRLEDWAKGRDGFSSWIVVAYAYAATNEPARMEDTVLKALRFPPDDPSWISMHARARSVMICINLFQAGRYDTCSKLCSALLDYTGANTHLADEINRIRIAASRVIAGENPTTISLPKLDLSLNPLHGVPMNQLLVSPATTRAESD